MATATVKKKVIEIVAGVALELTGDEAQVLRDILGGAVCGSGPGRVLADDVLTALTGVGFKRGSSYPFQGRVEF